MIAKVTDQSDMTIDIRPDGTSAEETRETTLSVSLLPPTDVIGYVGRQHDRVTLSSAFSSWMTRFDAHVEVWVLSWSSLLQG